MRIIGLTGGLAMGKTTVAQLLKDKGAVPIDADQISRDLTRQKEIIDQVVKLFGLEVLQKDGQLDRKKLAEIVFSDAAQRKKLEALLHPLVQRQIEDTIAKLKEQGVQTVVLDIPLLFETGYENKVDEVWAVNCPLSLQLQRAKQRNGWTEEEALVRIAGQLSAEERCNRAQVVIETGNGFEETYKQVQKAYEK